MKDKIVSLPQLIKMVSDFKQENKIIIWTNGCFDILHIGHIKYLMQAKNSGDVLIVGLNSDNSVKKLKGENRPVFNEENRAIVLSSIIYVDYIIMFNETSPLKLLEILKPHYFIKGGDYTIDSIDQAERKLIESYGGKIKILPFIEGASTSDIIKKLKLL